MTTYESKSTGWWVFAIAAALVVGGVVLAVIPVDDGDAVPFVGAALVAVGLIVANFGVLTVRVDGDAVSWRFGLGPLGWTVPLGRVRGVETSRSPWFWGWGIRWTPRGWLWRSTGIDVVWFELDSGRQVGVGTQDAERLARVVRERTESGTG